MHTATQFVPWGCLLTPRWSGSVEDKGPFTVVIADNFHYMDESEYTSHGTFDTLEAAIAAAKSIVDSFLSSALKSGMTAEQLYEQYVHFGDDPFIRGSNQGGVPFSAWNYARGRCYEMCPPGPCSSAPSGNEA
jgi:hypothetical protein